MENISAVFAENLKALRVKKKLSLDKVAELTGVSKTMLGQIERGESNPTLNTVWKIANGLKISFTSLIHQQQPDTVVITREDVQAISEDQGRYRIYPYFPFEESRRFEMYTIEIDRGGYVSADPHGEGTEELITVFDGEVTIRIEHEEFTIREGESIKFKADRDHAYHNSGDTLTRLSMVIYYPA